MARLKRIDIQTKIILVLVAVIAPTFFVMAIAQNKISEPVLRQEMRHVGIASAESIASQILTKRLLGRPETTALIEQEIQELLYLQPSIIRMDVYAPDETLGWRIIASNVEGETGQSVSKLPSLKTVGSEFKKDEDFSFWDITFPIEGANGKVLGIIHAMVSTRTVQRLIATYWNITVTAAALTTVILVIILNFFLRRAVVNERLLRKVESHNLELSEQLHETQRELMNVEKLAVMGQLTANFAHEIGTPLNAISLHLQLLDEETSSPRMKILRGEVSRIEEIVKGFLQTAAKPASQRQLVDLNRLMSKTLDFVRPQLDNLEVTVKTSWNEAIGPIRAVATDIEQILINLLNNSLDSLKERKDLREGSRLEIELASDLEKIHGKDWVKISLYDTGLGIKRENLPNLKKPFFTTKRPGQGTGLGLAICHELASRYEGMLDIQSREGAWTRVTLKMPYGVNV